MLLIKDTSFYRQHLKSRTHYLVAVLKGVNDAQARLEVENIPT